MKETVLNIGGKTIPQTYVNTVIVGTGAAGYNAADRLYAFGQKDIVVVTEGINNGTSRNTGSDKQTYYKLGLSGSGADSIRAMAQTIFDGGCVDGDTALAEAAMSPRCFMRLVELGVPFPTNPYGEYVGYKTDNDPFSRATSAGPLTSMLMTEALERSVFSRGIQVLDSLLAVRILVDNGEVKGLLCLNLDSPGSFSVFFCKNIILATGGPAGIYSDSVYPLGHYGSTGIALEAGALGRNLTEWQYGLASVNPRWNVSGTYMQSLPRFISTGAGGGDEREFLADYYNDPGELLTNVFLKGYEWPFDASRAASASSLIDILVYVEIKHKGRRVFLDYRSNPLGNANFSLLGEAAFTYLSKAGALFGTPVDRLKHMNMPAYEFYKNKGVDLAESPLEIALCAQHNNGGLAVDMWWQTNIEGLFAAGEAAGTHGVYRPGGSALNAGQAGSTRAALYISKNRRGEPGVPSDGCIDKVKEILSLADNITGCEAAYAMWERARKRMSRCAAAIRDISGMRECLEETQNELRDIAKIAENPSPHELYIFFRLRDTLITQTAYLSAMLDYVEKGGKSRGSSLYIRDDGDASVPGLPIRFTPDDGVLSGVIQEAIYSPEGCKHVWRAVRQIPEDNDFFENVWRDYRENGNVKYC